MKPESLEPRSPGLDALVRGAAVARPEAPPDLAVRVQARVFTTLGLSGGGAPPIAPPRAHRWLKPVLGGLAAAAIGAAVIVLMARKTVIAHRQPAATTTAKAVTVSSTPAPSAESSTPIPSARAASSAAAPAPPSAPLPELRRSPRSQAPEPSDDLAAEAALLDEARGQLSAKHSAAALAALDRHARRFPHGQLAEARERLAIEALLKGGERDAARERAERFRAVYPRSLFLPVIDHELVEAGAK